MTTKYLLEQLNRFEKDTRAETEEASNDLAKDYITYHNEGHLLAIEAIRNVLQTMNDHLNKDVIKKFAKNGRERSLVYTRSIDAKHQVYLDTIPDNAGLPDECFAIFDANYFRAEGRACAYYTVLEIIRKERYFNK